MTGWGIEDLFKWLAKENLHWITLVWGSGHKPLMFAKYSNITNRFETNYLNSFNKINIQTVKSKPNCSLHIKIYII